MLSEDKDLIDWHTFPTTDKQRYWFSVSEDGKVLRTNKKTYNEVIVPPFYKKGKTAAVKVNGKEQLIKHLVAAAFLVGYESGMGIFHKDGCEKNCSADNLVLVSRSDLGRMTGAMMQRRTPVKLLNLATAEVCTYASIREAARSLFCSYQTVIDYINGRVKNSALKNYKILN